MENEKTEHFLNEKSATIIDKFKKIWYTESNQAEGRTPMRCEKIGEKMILTPKSAFKINRIAKLLIIFCSLTMICLSLPLNGKNLPVYIAVGASWLIALAVGAWLIIVNHGYRIVIDETGVRETRSFFKKKCAYLAWSDIQDWGYCRFDETPKGMYVLYFSKEPLGMENGRKTVDKRCICIVDDFSHVQTKMDSTVIPFCGPFSPVWPFRPNKTEL